jgi:hypothetical protein
MEQFEEDFYKCAVDEEFCDTRDALAHSNETDEFLADVVAV